MRKKSLVFLVSVFLAIVACQGIEMTVLGNSGPSYWEKEPAGEMLVIDKNSPIEVVSEQLEFSVHYSTGAEESIYADVKALYNMYNSSDEAQTVQMAFPLVSDYQSIYVAKPEIMLKDTKLEYQIFPGRIVKNQSDVLRKSEEELYSFESITKAIHKEYLVFDGLVPETQGTLYIIKSDAGYENIKLMAEFGALEDNVKIITSGFYHDVNKKDKRYLGALSGNAEALYIFVYNGKADFTIKGYDDWEASEEVKLDYMITESVITYSEFYNQVMLPEMNRNCNVFLQTNQTFNRIQQYNSETQQVVELLTSGKGIALLSAINGFYDELNDRRIFTIVFDAPFSAQEDSTISVKYRMPGSYDVRQKEYPEFSFEYVLNPASYWKSFKDLSIALSIPDNFNGIKMSSIPFDLGDDGVYNAKFNSLPKEDLVFVLNGPIQQSRESDIESDIESNLDSEPTQGFREQWVIYVVIGLCVLIGIMVLRLIRFRQNRL